MNALTVQYFTSSCMHAVHTPMQHIDTQRKQVWKYYYYYYHHYSKGPVLVLIFKHSHGVALEKVLCESKSMALN